MHYLILTCLLQFLKWNKFNRQKLGRSLQGHKKLNNSKNLSEFKLLKLKQDCPSYEKDMQTHLQVCVHNNVFQFSFGFVSFWGKNEIMVIYRRQRLSARSHLFTEYIKIFEKVWWGCKMGAIKKLRANKKEKKSYVVTISCNKIW